MKRNLLIFLLFSLCLTACSVNDKTVKKINIKEETIEPHVVENVALDASNVKEDEEIVFTNKMKSAIKKYYSKYSYVEVTQEIQSGVDVNSLKPVSFYKVIVDTKNKLTHLSYNEDGSVVFETIHDYKEDKTYVRNKKGTKWIEKEGKFSIIDWDLNKFDSVYDVYDYMIGENQVLVKSKGNSDGKKYIFYDEIKKVSKKDISGVSFDKLKSQINILVLTKSGNSFKPDSNMIEINYTKDNQDYFSRIKFTLDNLSNDKLKFKRGEKNEEG